MTAKKNGTSYPSLIAGLLCVVTAVVGVVYRPTSEEVIEASYAGVGAIALLVVLGTAFILKGMGLIEIKMQSRK
jgi:hypothetical protein